MGSVISQAANGIGGVVGNAFAVPIKTIFGVSCEDVCSGPWDLICFIEHLCVSDLLKLLMVFGLSYITLMFFYLLFKVGICQCIGKSLCKMCWAGCETYCFALQDITCFLWHKLKNTERVNRRRRRRFRDIETGYTSTTSSSDHHHQTDFPHHFGRKRKSIMRGKVRSPHHPSSRHGMIMSRNINSHHHHHLRLKTREISPHVKGGSRRLRNSRQLQLARLRNPQRNLGMLKKRRVR